MENIKFIPFPIEMFEAMVAFIPSYTKRWHIWGAVIDYVVNGAEPQGLDAKGLMVFRQYAPMIKKYVETRVKQAEGGKSGGEYGYMGGQYGSMGGRPRKETTKDEPKPTKEGDDEPNAEDIPVSFSIKAVMAKQMESVVETLENESKMENSQSEMKNFQNEMKNSHLTDEIKTNESLFCNDLETNEIDEEKTPLKTPLKTPQKPPNKKEELKRIINNNNKDCCLKEKQKENAGQARAGQARHLFVKPTTEEIFEFIRERNFVYTDASAFVEYYGSVGWVVGKSRKPMKDWKLAVIGWERRQAEEHGYKMQLMEQEDGAQMAVYSENFAESREKYLNKKKTKEEEKKDGVFSPAVMKLMDMYCRKETEEEKRAREEREAEYARQMDEWRSMQ